MNGIIELNDIIVLDTVTVRKLITEAAVEYTVTLPAGISYSAGNTAVSDGAVVDNLDQTLTWTVDMSQSIPKDVNDYSIGWTSTDFPETITLGIQVTDIEAFSALSEENRKVVFSAPGGDADASNDIKEIFLEEPTPIDLIKAIHPVISFQTQVFDADGSVATGDGVIGFVVPEELDGRDVSQITIYSATAGVSTVAEENSVQVRRVRAGTPADMLSTPLTYGDTETSAVTGTDGTIDAANADLAEGDIIYIDVDAVQLTNAPLGLWAVFETVLP